MTIRLIWLAALALVSGNSLANAQSTPLSQLNWSVNSAPPFHIFAEPFAQQGICDVLIESVHNHLPNTQKQIDVMPHNRISMSLRNSANTCFPCMIYRPDYQAGVVFSKPTHFYRPHGIITTPTRAEEMREQFGEPIRLAELLRSKNYSFGQPAGRKYGVLQSYLEQYVLGSSRHVSISGDSNFVQLLTLIMNDRVDFTIDYDIMKRYFERTQNEELAFLPIAENQDQLVLGAVGCSDNAWGRQAVATINQAIPAVRDDERFQDVLKLWLGSQDDDSYLQRYDAEIKAKYED